MWWLSLCGLVEFHNESFKETNHALTCKPCDCFDGLFMPSRTVAWANIPKVQAFCWMHELTEQNEQTEQIKFEWFSADQLNWLNGKKRDKSLRRILCEWPEWICCWPTHSNRQKMSLKKSVKETEQKIWVTEINLNPEPLVSVDLLIASS